MVFSQNDSTQNASLYVKDSYRLTIDTDMVVRWCLSYLTSEETLRSDGAICVSTVGLKIWCI